jgi:hypothetical protein
MVYFTMLNLHYKLKAMKKYFITLIILLNFNISSFAQKKNYICFSLGAYYAQNKMPELEAWKVNLANKYKLGGVYTLENRNIGPSVGIYKGEKNKWQMGLNWQLSIYANSLFDTISRKFMIGHIANVLTYSAGLNVAKSVRIDAGINLQNNTVKFNEIGNFYNQNSTSSANYSFYLSPSFDFIDSKSKMGISIAPYYNLGFSKFNFLEEGNILAAANGNIIKSKINGWGIKVALLFFNKI